MVKAAEGGDVIVTEESALQVSAVTNGLSFISNDVAGLPFRIYQRTRDGRLEMVRGDPLEVVLNGRWSAYETSAAARQRLMTSRRRGRGTPTPGASAAS